MLGDAYVIKAGYLVAYTVLCLNCINKQNLEKN